MALVAGGDRDPRMLPVPEFRCSCREMHGYRSREILVHMLWEMIEWLERYVKNPGEKQAMRE